MAPATDDVVAALDALREEVECCSGCVLGATRTKAVFGEGDPGADLMFVGEAPGYHEDQQGRPFVGQAGKLLEQLLASIGMTREQVYIANVLKSRPPNNRDPRPEEIDACRPYLFRQIEIIKPKVICTLGNFATKLLTRRPHRHHQGARSSQGHGDRRAPALPVSDLPSRGGALHAGHADDAQRGLLAAAPAAGACGAQAGGGGGRVAGRGAAGWRPPEHLRRDVAPGAARRRLPRRPRLPSAAPEPTLEDMARITLGATPIDEGPPASRQGAPSTRTRCRRA